MILFELMIGGAVLGFFLLLLPLALLLAGLAGAIVIGLCAPLLALAVLLGWLALPAFHSPIVLVLLCVIGLLFLERRSRRRVWP